MNNDTTMTDLIYQSFADRKQALFSLLDTGVIVKSEWDALINDARNLHCDSSVAQLERYYQHYHIAEMGTVESDHVAQ